MTYILFLLCQIMHDILQWIVWCSNLTVFNFSLFYPFNQCNSNIFQIFFIFESSIYQKKSELKRHHRLHTDKSLEIVLYYVDAIALELSLKVSSTCTIKRGFCRGVPVTNWGSRASPLAAHPL